MIALSKSARRSLDDYLRQARAYLRGSRSVDAAEVEQNITEHIENALEGAREPVSCDDLEAVLEKLGNPQQWVPEDELAWWRRIILRLRTGPEDWRLAYMSFSLFVVGLVLMFSYPVFVVLIFASFFASRAAISQTPDCRRLKAQKWLIYPSLITVYGFVLGTLFTLPFWIVIGVAVEYEGRITGLSRELDYWFTASSAAFATMGAWWVILALTVVFFGKKAVVLLRPFADAYKARWAFLLLIVGLSVTMVSAGIGLAYYTYFT